MANALELFEKRHINEIMGDKNIPNFSYGDTVIVNVKVVSGSSERIQAFEGLCIARRSRGLGSTFTVRKISNNSIGVDRTFGLYSPRIDSIKIVKRGIVRRAKLYYMRKLFGKNARIRERRDYNIQKTKILK